MSDKDGGPAFPSLDIYESYNCDRERYEVKSDTATGMSLRDYFAAHAMTGLAFCLDSGERGTVGVAKIAYELADAMLAVRVKP